ncbi:class F sortase [Streptomyces sp. SID1328]|uniref:class F sortase n=1 Tax=Streptomyces sp. SID1328 TaxID=2690250 RepID=UPI00136BF97D|nr:class F sortase [Streptomyces sp. SID1328]MYV39019.1 class F sortase [Streptomyces sp. SID1328]
MQRRVTTTTLTLALGLALAACGTQDSTGHAAPPPPSPVSTPAAAPAKSAAPMARSLPVRVTIPSAGVDTGPVLKLGLAADGTVEVPSVAQASRIGWYSKGVTPGETGPAVLIGHYDTVNGPAVLRNVGQIKQGARITVARADGSSAVFSVRTVEQVDKDAFPTGKVYGDTTRPELRLITCGGAIENGHRPDNIIIYGDLVPPKG